MRCDVKLTVDILRYCEESGARCGECPSGVNENGVPNCHSQAHIADLIESLAAELEQVKRERDALQAELDALNEEYFSDVHTARDPMLDKIRQLERERDAYYDSMQGICATCKKARYCMLNPLPKCPNWQWRGVKEVNE